MKSGIGQLVGKTVTAVVVASKKDGRPPQQVFVVLDDGTYFELYGADIHATSGVCAGGVAEAIAYARLSGATVDAVYAPAVYPSAA